MWAGTDGILVGQSLASRPVFKEGIKGEFIGDVHDAILSKLTAESRPQKLDEIC